MGADPANDWSSRGLRVGADRDVRGGFTALADGARRVADKRAEDQRIEIASCRYHDG